MCWFFYSRNCSAGLPTSVKGIKVPSRLHEPFNRVYYLAKITFLWSQRSYFSNSTMNHYLQFPSCPFFPWIYLQIWADEGGIIINGTLCAIICNTVQGPLVRNPDLLRLLVRFVGRLELECLASVKNSKHLQLSSQAILRRKNHRQPCRQLVVVDKSALTRATDDYNRFLLEGNIQMRFWVLGVIHEILKNFSLFPLHLFSKIIDKILKVFSQI